MLKEIKEKAEILSRTPEVLECWLGGLSESWIEARETPDSWSPFDVVGHLIHGEKTDWIPRARIILEFGDSIPFEPFDREAQLVNSQGLSLKELLREFALRRRDNVVVLESLPIDRADLDRRGRHPELGPVTLGELLNTWVVHDLGHIAQISRAMAKRYQNQVGPWVEYLPVLAGR